MRLVKQRLSSTRLADGTEIAYALVGQGPLMVHAPGWLTHLEFSWALPAERGFYEMLARGRTGPLRQPRLRAVRSDGKGLVLRTGGGGA